MRIEGVVLTVFELHFRNKRNFDLYLYHTHLGLNVIASDCRMTDLKKSVLFFSLFLKNLENL